MHDLRAITSPDLPASIARLQAQARAEGFRFLDRCVAQWQSGAQRYSGPGEVLLGAYRNDTLVGIGGLSQDQYLPLPGIGRLRHIYVLDEARGTGIGAALVQTLLSAAVGHFHQVRLRAAPRAAPLYLRHGFRPITDPDATHSIVIPTKSS